MEQSDPQTARESSDTKYEASAEELELAARHLRSAAGHVREGEIPRASAHAFAAHGHIVTARQTLEQIAVLHASRSNPG